MKRAPFVNTDTKPFVVGVGLAARPARVIGEGKKREANVNPMNARVKKVAKYVAAVGAVLLAFALMTLVLYALRVMP